MIANRSRKEASKKKRLPAQSLRFSLSLFFAICACFALDARAQNLDDLAARIRAGDTERKRGALAEIRNLGTADAARLAVPALGDAAEIVRATAASAIIFLPSDEALQALAPNLTDKSELVRRETAYALGKTRNPAAVAQLVRTFQNDKIAEVRNAALIALGEIGDAAAIDALIQVFRAKPTDANEFTRRSAARAIGQIAQFTQTGARRVLTPESFLPEKFKLESVQNYRNLSETDPRFRAAVPFLIAIMQNAGESADAKREAAFALGAIGDPAATAVLEANRTAQDYYLAEIAKESLLKIASVE